MVIKDLTLMGRRHGPSAARNLIEGRPKGLQDLTVHLAGRRNVVGRVPSNTLILVTMNMEKADARRDLKAERNRERWAGLNTLVEILPVLAADVIEEDDIREAAKSLECLAQGVVHVSLSEAGGRTWPE